jgi:hypothetical protein
MRSVKGEREMGELNCLEGRREREKELTRSSR